MFFHSLLWIVAVLALLVAVGTLVMAYKLRSQTPESLKRDIRLVQISVAEMQDEHGRMVKLLQKVNARETMRAKREDAATAPAEAPSGDWKRDARIRMGMRVASGKHPVSGA